MAITWPDVVVIAAELASLGAAAQTLILEHVNTALNVSELGGESSPRLKLARIYLAAHLATISTAGGEAAGGPLIAETIDNISRSYASPLSVSASQYNATSYGQLFATLVRTSRARLPRAF